MSSQSGIKESVHPGPVITGSRDFEKDFELVAKHLKEDEASYILYKHENANDESEDSEKYAFISFVPDKAKVRSKMLYASSATSLQRELGGSNRFVTSLFWTEISEFSPEGWRSHVRHSQAPTPLTEEEKSLEAVREKEADQMLGTAYRRSHVTPISSGGINFEIVPEAQDAIKDLIQQTRSSSVALKIDLTAEKVILGDRKSDLDPSSLATEFIDNSSPQYTIYKFVHNHDGSVSSPIGRSKMNVLSKTWSNLVFIYTCPGKSKIKERMVYASNRESVISAAKQLGLSIAKIIEATDGSDISEQSLIDDLHQSKPVARPRFSRPKAPGTRK